MISANPFDSDLVNKIALDFANATSLAVVVVNIHGEEISERFNFTQFCQKLREDPELYARCKMSDRCGGLEASKENRPCIYRCHAGLTDFSIPLLISGNLVGFVLCGQVRLVSEEHLDHIQKIDERWRQDGELLREYESIPVVDYTKIMASAELLKLVVDNCIKKHLNFIVINESNEAGEANRAMSSPIYDPKIKKALRYIDSHFSEELRLEEVAAHVYLSPYYFSKLFKKQLGIGFNAYVTRQRMINAKQMLQNSDWSIASIAKNLGFSQTSYFCKIFRQTYQVTPQMYREMLSQEQ
ncbi:PocR ligand-binding domain-containing protein [Pseudaeromonas sp. ZJS20]|uniref:transcriptional regulator PocR n=1 Tax=Pseudaeromonas aegiceratis TaxID=3153928 RepID=UPI00390C9EDB